MIAYLDTSSLAKLYLVESGMDDVRALTSAADVKATSVIAFVEMRSALARKRRGGEIPADEYRSALRVFGEDWNGLTRVTVTGDLVRHAGELAERHAIRGMDAIHLASALWLRTQEGRGRIVFSTSDTDLGRAAREEGLSTTLEEDLGGSPGDALRLRERRVRWRRARKR